MKKSLVSGTCVALTVVALVSWVKGGSPQSHPAPSKTASVADKVRQASRLNNLGAAYMNQQAFEKALKYFQDAYASDPNLFAARLNQGIALLNLQKVNEAQPILQEAVKRDP
jgi:tetratricopeptide (TPR) repeat protein